MELRQTIGPVLRRVSRRIFRKIRQRGNSATAASGYSFVPAITFTNTDGIRTAKEPTSPTDHHRPNGTAASRDSRRTNARRISNAYTFATTGDLRRSTADRRSLRPVKQRKYTQTKIGTHQTMEGGSAQHLGHLTD